MKAVLWISFLLFAAFIGGTYYYYVNVYQPKQVEIKAAEQAKLAQMQADIEAERERIANQKTINSELVTADPPKPATNPQPADSELKIEIPKARPITVGGSIRDSLKEEKPKTPEELALEKELAEMRKILREMKAQGEREA